MGGRSKKGGDPTSLPRRPSVGRWWVGSSFAFTHTHTGMKRRKEGERYKRARERGASSSSSSCGTTANRRLLPASCHERKEEEGVERLGSNEREIDDG